MNKFFVIVAFMVFLIQMGVTVSNYREMVSFEDVLENDIENQLKVSHDMQMTLNNTQAVIMASAKANLNSTSISADKFSQIMSMLQTIISKQEIDYSFDRLMPYNLPKSSFKYRPSPLKP